MYVSSHCKELHVREKFQSTSQKEPESLGRFLQFMKASNELVLKCRAARVRVDGCKK